MSRLLFRDLCIEEKSKLLHWHCKVVDSKMLRIKQRDCTTIKLREFISSNMLGPCNDYK